MTTDPELRILSLGAGVQSTVLALMACDGTLPGLDAAIFADTGNAELAERADRQHQLYMRDPEAYLRRIEKGETP